MGTRQSILDAVGPDSDLYGRYRSRAAERLSTDPTLRAARRAWERFVRTSHGEALDDLSGERPRERLFLDTLYYDFVVDRLIASIERRVDVRLVNRESSANTDALGVDFGSLHGTILGADGLETPVDGLVDALDLATPTTSGPAPGSTLLRRLHESVVSPEVRLALGEYYTPRGVAEVAVAELAVDDARTETVLDPGCGSGVFLAACIDAKRRAVSGDLPPDALVDAITDTVYGIDLNPVAVKAAKLTYLRSLLPLLAESDLDRLAVPVFLTDALGLTRDDDIRFEGAPLDVTVDHLVGNPPWITWGDLPASVRAAWRDRYVDRLGLSAHSGVETQLGHANDDVSVPFVWACVHRYLAEGGDASVVLKRGLTKGPAGRLFRTRRVGDRPVAVSHVHDFNRLRPFGDGVDVASAVYTLRADVEGDFPIETTSWTAADVAPSYATAGAMRETLDAEGTGLVPVRADDPASPWIRRDAEARALGTCPHRIRHGVKDDAKAVYSLDRDRLDELELEPDHVYPYLRSKHVVKYGLFGHDLHLVPLRRAHQDNETELRRECPATYAYLASNRETLADRSSTWLEKGPFYNVFGLGEYTWADYKVVWCRLGFKPHFAVVSTLEDTDLGEQPVVPGDHCMFVPTDDRREAHFLCGLLNSAPYQACLRDVAGQGKASLTKAVVSELALPAYEGTADGERLADRSMRAHEIVPDHTDVSKRAYNRTRVPELERLQAEMDDLVETMLATGRLGDAARR
jgi:SAM-dependent methyltransferase